MTIIINCKEAQPVNQFISQQNYKEEKEQGKENILIKVVIQCSLLYVVWKLWCKICIYIYIVQKSHYHVMHAPMHVATCKHTESHTHTHACTCVHTHARANKHAHKHLHTRMHTNTQTHT